MEDPAIVERLYLGIIQQPGLLNRHVYWILLQDVVEGTLDELADHGTVRHLLPNIYRAAHEQSPSPLPARHAVRR